MNKLNNSPIYSLVEKQILKLTDEKEPIRKGCLAASNGGCNCTGACQEIIGWRDKNVNNTFPNLIPKKEEVSHFEDIEEPTKCTSTEHNPPTHLHIPNGKRYVHICPSCKTKIILEPPQKTF